jgi:hypothetical protein
MRQKRTKGICIRLSDAEHRMFSKRAEAAGVSISSLLRDHVNRKNIYNHNQHQLWYATLISLRKQLAGLLKRASAYEPVDAAIVIAYTAAIARSLDRLSNEELPYAREIFCESRNGDK